MLSFGRTPVVPTLLIVTVLTGGGLFMARTYFTARSPEDATITTEPSIDLRAFVKHSEPTVADATVAAYVERIEQLNLKYGHKDSSTIQVQASGDLDVAARYASDVEAIRAELGMKLLLTETPPPAAPTLPTTPNRSKTPPLIDASSSSVLPTVMPAVMPQSPSQLLDAHGPPVTAGPVIIQDNNPPAPPVAPNFMR